MLLPVIINAVVLVGVVSLILNRVSYWRRAKGAKSPPGPKGLPVLGNMLDLAKNPNLVENFQKWSKSCGPITQFSVLGQKQVILSSETAVNDLFIKRGNIYSDRGTPPAVTTVAGGIVTAIMDRNELWRRQRKLFHTIMSIAVNKRFEPFMEIESQYTLLSLLKDPANFDPHLGRYAYGVLTRSGLGIAIDSTDHPVVNRLNKMNNDVLACFRPDKYLCNMMPSLLKLPDWLFPENKKLAAMHDNLIDFIKDLNEKLKTRINQKDAVDSLHKYFFENQSEYGLNEIEGGAVFIALMGAGARSPHNALLEFVIVMMQYPEWKGKLQSEVDRVVGDDRLPEFSDMPNLPTVRAVVKEAIRHRTIKAEIGIPHKLTQDDFYEGYFFPAGTIFHANASAIVTDPEMYPDGKDFNPARWLEPSYPTYREPLTQYPNLHNFASFGAGRRACPGYDFTQRSLTILVAQMAWACNIKLPIDPATKQPVKLDIKYEPTPNPAPLSFPAEITPRSEKRLAFVQEAVKRTMATDELQVKN